MKVSDIIIPAKANEAFRGSTSLNKDQDILQLESEDLKSYPPLIGVSGPDGTIMGAVERDTLMLLQQNCNGWVMGQILDRFHEGVVAVDSAGRIFYSHRPAVFRYRHDSFSGRAWSSATQGRA